MKFVKTSFTITKEQRDFLKNSPYSASKVVRKTIENLMKKGNPLAS